MASARPILAIGPRDGDLAKIVEETKSGVVSEHDDQNRLKELIKTFYENYLNNELNVAPIGIDKYSRKNLTANLAGVLDAMIRPNA